MIKNTIIVILLLLLLVTFYAYMCLSSNMIDFQKDRMEHIIKKENELNEKEKQLLTTEECNINLNKYKLLVSKITEDLTKTTTDMNALMKYANDVHSKINTKNTEIEHNPLNIKIEHNPLNIKIENKNPILQKEINPMEVHKEKLPKEIYPMEEHREKFSNLDNIENYNKTNLLDLPIEDGFITGLDD